jgi:signal transduction histidine kinase/CheY-like chemotaxis protein
MPEDAVEAPETTEGAEGDAPQRAMVATQPLVNTTPDLVFRIGKDGSCLELDTSRGPRSAVAAGEFAGKTLYGVLPPDVAREIMRLVERSLRTGQSHTFEYQLTAHGDLRKYQGRLIPTGEDEVVALVRDVSSISQLEDQMLQSQKMEAVGHLAGGVAHDFNNILTAIMGYCQLGIRAQPPGDELSASLRGIQKAAEYGAGLCRQLLVFSRQQTEEPRITSLDALVLDMETMLKSLIGEDIELVIRPRPNLGLVKVDPGQIELVLVNLAVNARDAMPDGGTLTVETANVSLDERSATQVLGPAAAPGYYVTLSVSDTGAGIPADVKAHIFEPFFTTKERGKGTGFGLYTCRGIVTRSGGYIGVDSEPGKGATFKIYLPRADESLSSAMPPDVSGYLPRGRETVLLVEDDQVVREVAARALRVQGYTVFEAAEGVEALSLALKHISQGVDLLFTDVIMPLMNGSELAQRLRKYYPGVRVLFTSGYSGDTIDEIRLQEQDAVFIEKPFTPDELAWKVRAVLES